VLFVATPAVRPDGTVDEYLSRWSFLYYPAWPPSVTFVDPVTKAYSVAHWPRISNSNRLALHPTYGGAPTGMICNSMFFEYYFWGGHGSPERTGWTEGLHTMAASVSELMIHLRPPYYSGPS
jgi:hypothetical protein